MFFRVVFFVTLSLTGCLFGSSPDPVVRGDASNDVTTDTDVGDDLADAQPDDDMMVEPRIRYVVTRAEDDRDDAQCVRDDCTLRQAILAALSQSERVEITFDDAVEEKTIQLTSALPDITACLVIEGGENGRIAVTSDGPSVFRFNGLRCLANEYATVRGMRLVDVDSAAIAVVDSDRVLIENNVIDNASTGVFEGGESSNVWLRNNVIINSKRHGLILFGRESLVEKNFIGALPDGNPGPNNGHGVFIGGADSSVLDNVIANNVLDGVIVDLLNREGVVTIAGNTFGRNDSMGSGKSGVVSYRGIVNIGGSKTDAGCDGPCNLFFGHTDFAVVLGNVSDSSSVYGNQFGDEAAGVSGPGIGIGGVREPGAPCENGSVCASGVCLREQPTDLDLTGGKCLRLCTSDQQCSLGRTCTEGVCIAEFVNANIDRTLSDAVTVEIGADTIFEQAGPMPCEAECNGFSAISDCAVDLRGPHLINVRGNQFGGQSRSPDLGICLGVETSNAQIEGNLFSSGIGVRMYGYQHLVDNNLFDSPTGFDVDPTSWGALLSNNVITQNAFGSDAGFCEFEDNIYPHDVTFQNPIAAPSVDLVAGAGNSLAVTVTGCPPLARVGFIGSSAGGATHENQTCNADEFGAASCILTAFQGDDLLAYCGVEIDVYDLDGTDGAIYQFGSQEIIEAPTPFDAETIADLINQDHGSDVAFPLRAPNNPGARIAIIAQSNLVVGGDVSSFGSATTTSSFSPTASTP